MAQVRRAGETGPERRPFSRHPWGSGQGLRWGLAEVKMAPWFPCGQWEEAQAVVCCSQRGGTGFGLECFWPGWGHGASGCLLGSPPSPRSRSPSRPVPFPDRTHPCKAQGRGQPQGCPASPTAHVFTLGQASSGTGRQSRGQPGKALLPAWAAAGSQQKTKAGFSPGLEALVEEGAGPGRCHPKCGCTPAGAWRSQARPGQATVTSGG